MIDIRDHGGIFSEGKSPEGGGGPGIDLDFKLPVFKKLVDISDKKPYYYFKEFNTGIVDHTGSMYFYDFNTGEVGPHRLYSNDTSAVVDLGGDHFFSTGSIYSKIDGERIELNVNIPWQGNSPVVYHEGYLFFVRSNKVYLISSDDLINSRSPTELFDYTGFAPRIIASGDQLFVLTGNSSSLSSYTLYKANWKNESLISSNTLTLRLAYNDDGFSAGILDNSNLLVYTHTQLVNQSGNGFVFHKINHNTGRVDLISGITRAQSSSKIRFFRSGNLSLIDSGGRKDPYDYNSSPVKIVNVGSQDMNLNTQVECPDLINYVGVDEYGYFGNDDIYRVSWKQGDLFYGSNSSGGAGAIYEVTS